MFFVPFVVGAAVTAVVLSAKKKLIDDDEKARENLIKQNLQDENERLQARIKEREAKIDELAQNAQKHRDADWENDAKIDELEDKLEFAERKSRDLEQQNELYLSKIREREGEIDALKAELGR